MKWSQIITGLLISVPALAANDSQVMNGLNDINAAQQQTRYLMQSSLSPTDRERVRYIDQRLMSAINQLQNSLNNPGNPPPYQPPSGSTVELYHDDRCTSDLIGHVNYSTNCEMAFTGASTAWAIRVNGQCMDIADMAATKACEVFKAAGSSTNAVKIFHDDRCASDLVAIVNYSTNCQMLSGLQNAWAIEVNGQCTDIADTSAVSACERFKQ